MKTIRNGAPKITGIFPALQPRRAWLLPLGLIIGVLMVSCGGSTSSNQSADKPGTEEFGLTQEELVTGIEAVEAQIAACMREAGFEYTPVDYLTVRKAMNADKSAPGLTEKEWAAQFGYGITTKLGVANAPQLADADIPARIGLGEGNIRIFNSLSAAEKVAYNRTLFGENTDATFAVTLEAEDFSRTGGCTRAAIEQVFKPEELSSSYYNPKDALIEQDPRVIAAISKWRDCMREAGFDYNNPEEIGPSFRERLDAITHGADPATLSAEAHAALTELQGEERATAVADMECDLKFVQPAEHQVETELYGASQQ